MAERKKLTEDEIRGYVQRAIETAVLYDEDDVALENKKAIDYFYGRMDDIPHERGRSKAVSRDVADTIGWLMPQVMRTFTSSDVTFEYQPRTPADRGAAKQATDYVNYVFNEECQGYQVLYEAVHDGFLLRNGLIKHWWDDSPQFDVSEYRGLSEMQVTMMTQSDDVEVLEYSEVEPEEVQQQDPETGQPVTMTERRFDMKLKTLISDGKLCVEAVPPEDILMEPGARSIEDTRFIAHRSRKTRSDLLEMGFKADKVDEIPEWEDWGKREEDASRHEGRDYDFSRSNILDRPSEWVEIYEAFLKIDANGDGVTEWVRCIVAGGSGSSVLLDSGEWDEDVPFTPIIPNPMPHRWLGRSIADELMDIQQQKTVLTRQMLDNAYRHNNPTPVVDRQAIRDQAALDGLAVLDGTVVELDGNPQQAIQFYQIPYVGDKIMAHLQHLDQVRELRTGMSQAGVGLDRDVLQNQSATAVIESTAAAHAKMELYARNIAETGMKRLGRALYRLVVQNQSKPQVIRLRNEFVEVDPRGWAAEMDVSINVGLGTGSRERDAMVLEKLGAWGQNVIQIWGADNPLFGMEQARNIGAKMAETGQIKNYEMFIGGSPDQIQAYQQKMAEQAQQDPAAAEAQAKAQVEMQKAQMDGQLKQQELQQKAQIETAQMQQKAEMERQKMAQDAELTRQKAVSEVEANRYRVDQEMGLKRYQIEQEILLKRELGRQQMAVQATQVSVGGEPG